MDRIIKLLEQIEAYSAFSHRVNPKVSQASVGWHLEHVTLVISSVVVALGASQPEHYRPKKFSLVKLWILNTGILPRGKVKSPKSVQPKEQPTEQSVSTLVAKTKQKIQAASPFQPTQFFSHPLFGDLRLNQAIRFLEVHTRHHLNIIKDILKKN
jgi:hypothetical protein